VLGERECAVLEFESSWWLYPGPKDRAIREYLDMLTVRRLRKMRSDVAKRAADRRLGGGDGTNG